MVSYNLSFHDAENLKKTKGLNAEDVSQRENMAQSLDFIVSELKNVVYRFEQKYGVTVDKMICGGGASRIPGFVPYMEERLSFDVLMADPFAQAEAPEFLRGALAQAGPEFAVAIGLCVRALRG
jgi:Tfp pilus assembly PilM family ATPase